MTDPNTVELGAHPGAAAESSLVDPTGETNSLLSREVSADGMVRVNAGDSVGINLGMGYVGDGRAVQPVSLAAGTVYEGRDVFRTEAETAEPKVDELAAAGTALTTPKSGKAAKGAQAAG